MLGEVMASASRRARRANKTPNQFVMATESTIAPLVEQLNSALAAIDQVAQGVEDRAQATRLTQVVVLGGTALEILSGLAMAEQAAATAAAVAEADQKGEALPDVNPDA
jgi:hypothetical protein